MATKSAEIIEKKSSNLPGDDEKPRSQRGPGRPRLNDVSESSNTFFENCGKINPEDWSTRCWVYVYRKEPVIDRSGDWHYVDKYDENPKSEDRILQDHGSGKYRLMLNFTKQGAVRSSTIDQVVITLINVKFPPKVPEGEWVDDSRNKRWAWAKEFFAKPAQNGSGAGQVLETLKVFKDIQNGLKSEDQKPEPPQLPNPVSQVRETIQALKELAPQPPAATENATLQSIVQLIISQSKQQADQATAQIAAQSAQNNTLLQALLAQRNNPAPANTSFTDAINVISDKLLPLVEKLKPSAEEAISNFTRKSKMTGWQEMLQPAIPVVVDFLKPFGIALANRLMTPSANGFAPAAAPPQGTGAVPGALPLPPPEAGQTPQVPGQVSGFPPALNILAVPLLNWMREDADPRQLGKEFASWVHEGFSADPRFSQALTLARASGASSVIVAFKGSPYWLDKGLMRDQPSLADMEPKFQVFLESFLRWQPTDEEEMEEDEDVIDITGGEIQ